MPRIVSRNTSMYKRKGSFLSRTSSVASSSEGSFSRTPAMPWYAAVGLEVAGSNSSTASNSPSVASRRSLDSRSSVAMRKQTSSFGNYDSEDEIDGWGQFVDPAEAEEEIIRSSKILSKRYSLRWATSSIRTRATLLLPIPRTLLNDKWSQFSSYGSKATRGVRCYSWIPQARSIFYSNLC